MTNATPSSKRIYVAIGTRPEALKLAPIVAALRIGQPQLSIAVGTTGQQSTLVDQILAEMKLSPNFTAPKLDEPNLSTALGHVLHHVSKHLQSYGARAVLILGDTTSALGAALAAFHAGAAVLHLEAGLRTPLSNEPFPEEMNRRLISRLADYHFPTSQHGMLNLHAEGVAHDTIHLIPNPLLDLLDYPEDHGSDSDCTQFDALVTIHRREERRLKLHALQELFDLNPHRRFLIVSHPSIDSELRQSLHCARNMHISPPLSHARFLGLLRNARCVITDSGGVSEEAAALKIPLIIFRSTTERPFLTNQARITISPQEISRILATPIRQVNIRAHRQEIQKASPMIANRISEIVEALS